MEKNKSSAENKVKRILAGLAAFAIIAWLLWFANGLLGNPVSYYLAKNSAEKYVAQNYAADGYVIEEISYSFKDGSYHAVVAKPNSEDCRFSIWLRMDGSFHYDFYQDYVVSGFNTEQRLDMEYRKLVDKVTQGPNYPYSSDIAFGELMFDGDCQPDYALSHSILEIDKVYDIPELGAKAGKLTIYVKNESLTVERTAEILLDIKRIMDEGGVPFYAIDLTVRYDDFNNEIRLCDFRYADIYEDGLIERVEENRMNAEKYYKEMYEDKKT